MKRFGDTPLTPEKLWKSMEGVYEPMASQWYPLLLLLLLVVIVPLVPASEPALNELGYFVTPPFLIHGLPWWVTKLILLCAIFPILLVYNLYHTPRQFAIDELTIDPDLLEMKREELLYRKVYDERNKYITQRRQLVREAQRACANAQLDTL
jgi:hypothetical protein